jgi:hypothetical protein
LRNENLLAQFLQDFADVLLRVTLRDRMCCDFRGCWLAT